MPRLLFISIQDQTVCFKTKKLHFEAYLYASKLKNLNLKHTDVLSERYQFPEGMNIFCPLASVKTVPSVLGIRSTSPGATSPVRPLTE